jgi:signal transduction histidine kinase
MTRLRSLASRYWLDVLIVIAAAESSLEVAFRHEALRAPRSASWFAVPAITLVVLPLLARRRFPFGAPAAVWVLAAAVSFVDGRLVVFPPVVYLAGMAAAFMLGSLRDDRQARLGLVIVIGGAVIAIANDPIRRVGDLVFTPALFAMLWVAGYALRERAARAEAAEQRALFAEREREAAARVAVAEERARIARELHDVVAHAVSVMVLQVGAVRHKLPAGLDEDRDALQAVEGAGRAALTEMRRLLDAMRGDGEDVALAPQPGLDRLDDLVAEVGRAGLPVQLHVDGDPAPLPPGIDISAYRIIQEGLTNALKHAHASQAEVAIHYAPGELRIEVCDDGVGAAASDGQGYGLVGIRERVKLYGGEMTTGTSGDRGFGLRTRLPFASYEL